MENEVKTEIAKVIASCVQEGKDIVIRTGQAMELKDRGEVDIIGCIDTPALYCECKDKGVNAKEYLVKVVRSANYVGLFNFDAYPVDVAGKLEDSNDSQILGINDHKYVTPGEMAERIKMNRSLFDNFSEAMELVSILRNFRAKVASQIEKSDDKRGNASIVRTQAVESNLPKDFRVNIRPFEGQPRQTVTVEVYVNPDDLTCTLVSAEYKDIQAEIADGLIDDVIERIKAAVPGICIYEQ